MAKQETIRIKRNIFNLAGHLYKPDNFDENKQYPAIVVTHPGGGVKEQTSGLYAKLLSDHGFITIAYDASYQGESGGYPHFTENPADRVEDISWVIDYFINHPNVDNNRIGSLGICADGGYSVNAAQVDHRIKALGTISGIDIGWLFRDAFGNNQFPTIFATFDQVAQVRNTEALGAQLVTAPYLPSSPTEFTDATPEYAKEPYEYYNTPRAQYKTAENKVLLRSLPSMLTYDAVRFIDKLLVTPLLMVVGSKADTAYQSEYIIQNSASTDKELFVVNGATHVGLYDKMQFVEPAATKLAQFYTEKLSK
ncbi:alpha/beta hydrolase [Veillonella caviae]|uniref:alpha/beta hydrolase n=1 Tax=Veillonella caviae TaxID=248316 RepID=UPI0023F8401F|nr:alpha/beta hydrolase [Veillonella caviae]